MIGFNHALVGGLIGAYLPLPVALPAAIASHFVLDALPHYGIPFKKRDSSRLWKPLFVLDFFATLALSLIPLSRHHYGALICGFAAVAPDFVWVATVIRKRTFDLSSNISHYAKWHIGIQRYERPWGIWPESCLAIMLFVLVWRLV